LIGEGVWKTSFTLIFLWKTSFRFFDRGVWAFANGRDPVYLQNGVPCDKNDVYSYGVVLLELITGRKAIQQKLNLVQWCKDFLGPDEHVVRHLLPRMVDSRISLDISYEQLFEVVKVARSCVQERQESRPSMQDVVAWLHNANCKDSSPTNSEFPSAEVPLSLSLSLSLSSYHTSRWIISRFFFVFLHNLEGDFFFLSNVLVGAGAFASLWQQCWLQL
jgi:hypothetical protein